MKVLKIMGAAALVLVAVTLLTGHAYLWGGIRETYFRGWKNSNIDDIEFRDIRTIAAPDSAHAWIAAPVWGYDLSTEDRAWHETHMSASILVLPGDT